MASGTGIGAGVDDLGRRAGGEVDVGHEAVDRVGPGMVELVVLPEPEGPHDRGARPRRGRRRRRPTAGPPAPSRFDAPRREGVEPALVGVEDVLDDLELAVDDRRLTLAGRVDLAAGHDRSGVGGDHRVPRAAGGEVEQHRPETAVGRGTGEHDVLGGFLGGEEGVADGVREQPGLDQHLPDGVDLRLGGHGQRRRSGLGRGHLVLPWSRRLP